MTNIAGRRKARRFFATIGAAMRCTSRRMDTRRAGRTPGIRRVHGFAAVRIDALDGSPELMAR